jgi:hypothetical protein
VITQAVAADAAAGAAVDGPATAIDAMATTVSTAARRTPSVFQSDLGHYCVGTATAVFVAKWW